MVHAVESGYIFGHNIVVLQRHDWQVKTGQRSDLAGVVTPSIDHVIADQPSLFGIHRPFIRVQTADSCDPALPDNLRPHLPGASSQSQTGAGRIDMAIVRCIDPRDHPCSAGVI